MDGFSVDVNIIHGFVAIQKLEITAKEYTTRALQINSEINRQIHDRVNRPIQLAELVGLLQIYSSDIVSIAIAAEQIKDNITDNITNDTIFTRGLETKISHASKIAEEATEISRHASESTVESLGADFSAMLNKLQRIETIITEIKHIMIDAIGVTRARNHTIHPRQ